MNKTLIFLIISIALLVLSAIVICIAPLVNNIEVKNVYIGGDRSWKPSDWKNINCAIFADKLNFDNIAVDDIQKMRKLKNLCYRQKAMYGLEHSAFIINAILSFVCAYLALLHYLNVGKDFEKKTGLIGLISGVVGFILTLLYVCYSGYIFNNDIAYGILDTASQNLGTPTSLIKLYPNGAKYKYNGAKYILLAENEKGNNVEYVKYKDLGKKQYNYDSKLYEIYMKNNPGTSATSSNCNIGSYFTNANTLQKDDNNIDCDYLYYTPTSSVENKYIYDIWLTSLILGVFIFICDIALGIFGFLLFMQKGEAATPSEQMPIIYKK
jgi:hypothetical protein